MFHDTSLHGKGPLDKHGYAHMARFDRDTRGTAAHREAAHHRNHGAGVLCRADGDALDTLVSGVIGEAARLTEERGYRYFIILDPADASEVVSRYIPTQFQDVRRRGIGNSTPSVLYVSPGHTVKEVKPGLEISIRMYREGAHRSRKGGRVEQRVRDRKPARRPCDRTRHHGLHASTPPLGLL